MSADSVRHSPSHDLPRGCHHCHRWHPFVCRSVKSTDYANDMLFWQCVKGRGFYYAGQLGGTSRFETRRPAVTRRCAERPRPEAYDPVG